jgi:NAD binding domain of 6-phosphogluconate dehydrogenase
MDDLLARSEMMKVGFIGLGNMGAGMAANLLQAGHRVAVHNRTPAKAETLVQQGAEAAATIAEACRGDAVVTMLANDEAVERIVFGPDGVIASLPPGALHVSSARSASPWRSVYRRRTPRPASASSRRRFSVSFVAAVPGAQDLSPTMKRQSTT